ncbi:MAG: hypothetical protein SGILL_001239 [Bacillariaceae sp.]
MAPLINDFDFTIIDDLDFCVSSQQQQQQHKTSALHSAAHDTAPSSAAQRPPRSQRRNISFSETVVVHRIINREDFSAAETRASWYDRNDLRRMKDATKSEARLVESGVLTEGEDCSIRGLESKTANGLRAKRQSRMNAYAAVFFEIDNQDDMGMTDADAIADAYFAYSEPSLVTAQMIGVRDAEIAKGLQSQKPQQLFGGATSLSLLLSTHESTLTPIYSLAA